MIDPLREGYSSVVDDAGERSGTHSFEIAVRFLSSCFGEDVIAERILYASLSIRSRRKGVLRDVQ